ncbi:hypothetical protein AB205_0138550 [Aquarana catesbeiana]|uniref:Uncharacterized protein n=1 Tax=Aquarana catesbeiana TaxID=8400 RepID=A0A2G9QAR1_AQUCT|nr:hypothetical protein AB205_0138550 [Aquarana catesbeiana]
MVYTFFILQKSNPTKNGQLCCVFPPSQWFPVLYWMKTLGPQMLSIVHVIVLGLCAFCRLLYPLYSTIC